MTVWSEETVERAAALWRNGHSTSEIARAIGGVSRSAVASVANRRRDLFPLRGRTGRSGPKPGQARAKPRETKTDRAPAPPARATPARKPKPVPARPVPAPAIVETVPFLHAAESGLCLFFIGHHLSATGPDMPVCGAPREAGRYCAHHAQRATQAGIEQQEAT
ncbi:MAG: GcrA family cell cycle regulator [Rhizobiaceae bacterium]